MGRRAAESVLVPMPYAPHGLACVRSLGRNGVRTVVASENQNDPASASRYCDESVVVPSPHEDLLAYKDALRSLAERQDVRAIVPNREEDVYVLSKYRAEFEDHVAALWPSFETLRKVHDRTLLAEVAADAGVPAPETWLLDDVDVRNAALFVKPRYPILVDGYVDSYAPTECDPRTWTTYLSPHEEPDREAIVERMGHVPIVQEFVPSGGEEFAFIALYDRGEPLYTYQKRQLRGKTYAGGASVFRESVSLPELESVGRRLLDHMDWHGLAEVEFLRDPTTGEFKLIEVNPRTWGSLSCAIAAGADFPYYYWQLATGETDRFEPGYRVGVGNHSLFGELQYLQSVLRDDHLGADRPSVGRAAWEVAASCYDQPNFDYLQLDDPLPFVRGVLNLLPVGG